MSASLPAGSVITCEAGHEVCKVLVQLNEMDAFDPSALGDWRIDEPEVGTFPKCTCGAKFYSHEISEPFELFPGGRPVRLTKGMKLFTADGWWPKPQPEA